VDRIGIEPTSAALQVQLAPLEHAYPWRHVRESNPTGASRDPQPSRTSVVTTQACAQLVSPFVPVRPIHSRLAWQSRGSGKDGGCSHTGHGSRRNLEPALLKTLLIFLANGTARPLARGRQLDRAMPADRIAGPSPPDRDRQAEPRSGAPAAPEGIGRPRSSGRLSPGPTAIARLPPDRECQADRMVPADHDRRADCRKPDRPRPEVPTDRKSLGRPP